MKDLKDTLNEQLDMETHVNDGNADVIVIKDKDVKTIFAIQDPDARATNIIATDNIAEYLTYCGEDEDVINKVVKLKPGDAHKDRYGLIIRIK